MSLAVVGLGYWGPNLARNVAATPGRAAGLVLRRAMPARSRAPQPRFRASALSGSLEEVLADAGSTACCWRRRCARTRELAVRVLAAGKHCFVEKPLATSSADAQRVVDAAAAAGRVLMVGHLLEYHPGVRALGGADRGRASSARSTTSTPTASTSASCARTRTRSGASAPTTSR